MPPRAGKLHTWDGVGYGVLNDGDGQVLYYRRDMLTDPEHQAGVQGRSTATTCRSRRRPGSSCSTSPTSSTARTGMPTDAEPDSGTVLHLKVGEQGHYHFQSLSASFAITPGRQGHRTQNVYWFDPRDMKPLINSPGHVKALEFLQELHKTGPAAQVGWRRPRRGTTSCAASPSSSSRWGDVGALCQDEARSKVQGQVRRGHAARLRPGTRTSSTKEVGRARPSRAGRQHHRRLLARRRLAALGQAAGGGLRVPVADGDPAGFDLGRRAWLDRRRPRLPLPVPGAGRHGAARRLRQGRLGPRRRRGLSPTPTSATFTAPTMLPYLRIPGTPEYWAILDKNLSAAMSGRKTAAAGARRHGGRPGRGSPTASAASSSSSCYHAAIGYRPG